MVNCNAEILQDPNVDKLQLQVLKLYKFFMQILCCYDVIIAVRGFVTSFISGNIPYF